MFKQSSLEKMLHSQPNIPPLIKELSEKIKSPLDTIRKLQDMEVLDEKPSFPIIIVIGEASVGTSVIGTLVGLNLPTGLAFPVVLKFKFDSALPSRKIWLEFLFEDKYYEKEVSETGLAKKISKLVDPVPEGKRSKIKITLTIIQPQVSDLMVIVLPEIHTHHNKDEEKREMESIEGYIEHYTRCDDCLFLNVLSCSSNFDSCLSRKVLKGLDYIGTHAITVFTKVDLSSEYLITELTSNKIEQPTPFGYFFVDDTTEDDEKISKVDKEYIGFDVISKNIVTAMLFILFSPSSLILERIESDIEECVVTIERRQQTFDSVSDAIPVIVSIVSSTSISIYRLFISEEYWEGRKDEHKHPASNIALQFKRLKTNLHDMKLDNRMSFLQYEIGLLDSGNWLNLLSIVSSGNIKSVLNRQISYASSTVDKFVSSTMDYIMEVVDKILLDNKMYTWQLYPFMKNIGRELVEGLQKSFEKKLKELLDLEKEIIYTCNDDFTTKLNEMDSVKLELEVVQEFISIEGLGNNISVDHLQGYSKNQIKTAFELKKIFIVYWEFVVNRFVDNCFLNLRSLIKEMLTDGVKGVVTELMTSIEDGSKLPDAPPVVAINKRNLKRRIDYLEKLKEDIEKRHEEFEVFR